MDQGAGEREIGVPIITNGEAGLEDRSSVFELTKSMIEAGAACVRYEDRPTLVREEVQAARGRFWCRPRSSYARSLPPGSAPT